MPRQDEQRKLRRLERLKAKVERKRRMPRQDEKKEEKMITINGIQKELSDSMALQQLLEQEGYDIRRIAVEINGEIVSKSLFNETVVKSGDTIEVVSFVGGG